MNLNGYLNSEGKAGELLGFYKLLISLSRCLSVIKSNLDFKLFQCSELLEIGRTHVDLMTIR